MWLKFAVVSVFMVLYLRSLNRKLDREAAEHAAKSPTEKLGSDAHAPSKFRYVL